jgi:hypothetical protein
MDDEGEDDDDDDDEQVRPTGMAILQYRFGTRPRERLGTPNATSSRIIKQQLIDRYFHIPHGPPPRKSGRRYCIIKFTTRIIPLENTKYSIMARGSIANF